MTKKYLTVSALNNYLKRKVDIDSQLQIIYIKGEISNLKRNINSGHLYFTLKDEKSNISAIMYKGFAKQLTFDLKNGDHVLIEVDSVELMELDTMIGGKGINDPALVETLCSNSADADRKSVV